MVGVYHDGLQTGRILLGKVHPAGRENVIGNIYFVSKGILHVPHLRVRFINKLYTSVPARKITDDYFAIFGLNFDRIRIEYFSAWTPLGFLSL
jgi:hypothetical protein